MTNERVKEWLDSAPDIARSWLRSVLTVNAIAEQRSKSFQMIGRYDGAMSTECKSRFRDEYEFLSILREWQLNGDDSQ